MILSLSHSLSLPFSLSLSFSRSLSFSLSLILSLSLAQTLRPPLPRVAQRDATWHGKGRALGVGLWVYGLGEVVTAQRAATGHRNPPGRREEASTAGWRHGAAEV